MSFMNTYSDTEGQIAGNSVIFLFWQSISIVRAISWHRESIILREVNSLDCISIRIRLASTVVIIFDRVTLFDGLIVGFIFQYTIQFGFLIIRNCNGVRFLFYDYVVFIAVPFITIWNQIFFQRFKRIILLFDEVFVGSRFIGIPLIGIFLAGILLVGIDPAGAYSVEILSVGIFVVGTIGNIRDGTFT